MQLSSHPLLVAVFVGLGSVIPLQRALQCGMADSYVIDIQISSMCVLPMSASKQAAIPIMRLNTCIAFYIVFLISITNANYEV